MAKLIAHQGEVNSLNFSPDGKLLASGGEIAPAISGTPHRLPSLPTSTTAGYAPARAFRSDQQRRILTRTAHSLPLQLTTIHPPVGRCRRHNPCSPKKYWFSLIGGCAFLLLCLWLVQECAVHPFPPQPGVAEQELFQGISTSGSSKSRPVQW